jgi:antitoxin (DNA-binding transcriptional repressor) of toxin-antitoxin stability system
MDYLAIKDLKQTRVVREKLEKEGELVITKDGQPFAVMVGVEPGDLEESLREIRRALFSSAISQARRKALDEPLSDAEIEAEVAAARAEHAAS